MSMTTIFCYGALMRGQRNHDRSCRGAVSIELAVVRGRLYELACGFPMLHIPEDDILAFGTHNPLADIAMPEQFDEPQIVKPADNDTDWVRGELMTFYDIETRLPPIYRLDRYRPDVYRRVLVYVYCGAEAIPAWCYVAGELAIREILPTGRPTWP